jgi:hypothetical protein
MEGDHPSLGSAIGTELLGDKKQLAISLLADNA